MRKDNKYNILLHKSNLVFEWPLIGGQSSQDEGVSPSDCSSESEIEEPNFETKQLEAEENPKKKVIKEENPNKEVIESVKRKKDSTLISAADFCKFISYFILHFVHVDVQETTYRAVARF